jgi:hypothetical protein
MVHVIESLTEDWRRLDERIDQLLFGSLAEVG